MPAGEDDLSHARVVGEDVGRTFQLATGTLCIELSVLHITVNAQKAPLSCRLHISLQGMEWFIYNRTAAYDNVVSAMQFTFPDAPETQGRMSGEGIGSLRKIFSWTSVVPECMYALILITLYLTCHLSYSPRTAHITCLVDLQQNASGLQEMVRGHPKTASEPRPKGPVAYWYRGHERSLHRRQ